MTEAYLDLIGEADARYVYYTPKMFSTAVSYFINSLVDKEFGLIVSLQRGGDLLAKKLSENLFVPYLSIRPDNQEHLGYIPIFSDNVLIVDDIADSGETLRNIVDYCAQYNIRTTTAVLVLKSTSKFIPTLHGIAYQGEQWVKFFWENTPDYEKLSSIKPTIGGM